MAVIIQEVVGCRHGDRYYPHLSGVCRSYNFYPDARARPEEGVVNLALGLGKTIVDGGVTWSYAPPRPQIPPPFGSVRDQMKLTQAKFWAVNMGKPPAFNPIAETEYLLEAGLDDAWRPVWTMQSTTARSISSPQRTMRNPIASRRASASTDRGSSTLRRCFSCTSTG